MIPRLLLSSLILLVLTAPARADEILLPESGLSITVPSGEGWALERDAGDMLERTVIGVVFQHAGFSLVDVPCGPLLEHLLEEIPDLQMRTGHFLPASWHPDWAEAANGYAILCLPLDHEWSMSIRIRNDDGALDELSPIIDTFVRAVRHQRSEYESKEGLWLPNAGVQLVLETDDVWWKTESQEGRDMVYQMPYAANLDMVSVASLPAEVSACEGERAVALENGVEDRELVYAILGSAIRSNDGESVMFCGHFRGADYLVIWLGDLTATGSDAEVTRALVRALTASLPSNPVYELEAEGDGVTTAPETSIPEPRDEDDDGGLTVRSSLTQVDVRAGIALLAPAMIEDTTGFAIGASLPPRFVNSLLVVEGNVMFMNGGDVGTMLEVHAGVGVGKRFDGLELAWTGGVGATGLGHLDDGGAEEGGGPHVYTGPYLRLDNAKFALGVEAALILNSHPDQSRVRVDLTTATWKRKLGLALERSRAIDGSAITISLAVGLL